MIAIAISAKILSLALLGLLVLLIRFFLGRTAGRIAFALFLVVVFVAPMAVSFLDRAARRNSSEPNDIVSLGGSIPVEMGDRPSPSVATAGTAANHVQAKLGRPRRSLLLAMIGAKPTAKQSASTPLKVNPPVTPGAPLTLNPSPARGEGNNDAASKRPAWIDAQPDRVGDAFQMAVSVGPYQTLVQCDKELPTAIRDAIQDYAESYLDHRARGVRLQLDNLESLPANLIAETYLETVTTSFGPMQQLHARLSFDHRASQWVREQVRDALVTQRLWYVGGGAAGVLAVLAVLWAGLKLGRKAEVAVC